MIGISACLLGFPCRYNGQELYHPLVEQMKEKGEVFFPICPEVAGGLSTPRSPCEFLTGDGNSLLQGQGKIITREGKDVTDKMVQGGKIALEVCEKQKIKQLMLQAGSPSCGYGWIYDGTFTGKKKKGDGIFAAMAKKKGLLCFSVRGEKIKKTTEKKTKEEKT
ncbi:MAG: DUF523 domain-containing protein [Clostridiales bacterium]|nr:DUF523 domain-containing protein [Clostridiales bacterium]